MRMTPGDERRAFLLRDSGAERAVLRGVLREPHATFLYLARRDFTPADFGNHLEMVTFDLLRTMWKRGMRITPVSVYDALRNEGIDVEKPHVWIGELWFHDWWPSDIMNFWESEFFGMSYETSMCLAASNKVKWMAVRRDAIYRANEVIQNAIDGAIGPEYYEGYQ